MTFPARSGAGAGLALVLIAAASQAHAWGATGHRLIGQLGAAGLPADVPAFMHTSEAIETVGETAREPDRSKGSGLIHDSSRDPGHFTDVDDAGRILGGPALNALPPTRAEYDTALRAVNSNEFKAGYLPYNIVDGFQQLTKDFAYWRALTAAIPLEKDLDHRAWMQRDLIRRERLILTDMGMWAHFVGDGSQPMHVSVHYNGWGNYPNPNGYTQDRVHAYFEGEFVRQHVTYEDVKAAMAPPTPCKTSIEVCTAQYLATTAASTEPYYALQKAGGFVGADPRGIAFASQRIAAAAAELRDLTAQAWAASAHGSIGYPPVTVDDVVSGKVDPYEELYGED